MRLRWRAVNYEVKVVRDGRGGWVYYRENDATLPFDWDITSDGFEVYLPPPAQWEVFCNQHNATQCIGERALIVKRLVEEVQRKQAKKSKVTIDEMGISFSFTGDRLHSLASWLLDV